MTGAQNTFIEPFRKLSNSLFPIRLHVHAATVVYCIHENRQTELVTLQTQQLRCEKTDNKGTIHTYMTSSLGIVISQES